VFGDVHMLSHLVGAANRADIRRLRQLEQENEALAEKVERQQCRLNDGFAARDQTIRQLNELVARQSNERSERSFASGAHQDKHNLDELFQDLNRRLVRETVRREHAEQQANRLSASLEEKEQLLRTYEEERASYREELGAAERQLAMLIQPEAPRSQAPLDLSGIIFLYVGGRPHQVPGFKTMVERTGARFLHHDGGIEDSSNLIPGLISRADRVFFPIDCISHDAVGTIKRLCRLMTKTYEPLRTASLSCLLSALTKASVSREVISP
jgi:ribosome-binding protein aMBF1 (putative translation factor)